jgi:hypothetical protein
MGRVVLVVVRVLVGGREGRHFGRRRHCWSRLVGYRRDEAMIVRRED